MASGISMAIKMIIVRPDGRRNIRLGFLFRSLIIKPPFVEIRNFRLFPTAVLEKICQHVNYSTLKKVSLSQAKPHKHPIALPVSGEL